MLSRRPRPSGSSGFWIQSFFITSLCFSPRAGGQAAAADPLAEAVPDCGQVFIANRSVKTLCQRLTIRKIHPFDRPGRAGLRALPAFAAAVGHGLIAGQRRIGQHRHQTEAGADLLIDQGAVLADPAMSGQMGRQTMAEDPGQLGVTDPLGSRDGKGNDSLFSAGCWPDEGQCHPGGY